MTATDVLKCSPLLWLLPTELLAKIVDDYLPDLPSVLRIWDSVENNTDSESNHARAWKKVLTMLAKNGVAGLFSKTEAPDGPMGAKKNAALKLLRQYKEL